MGQRQPEGSDDCPVTRFTYQTGPRAAPSSLVKLTKMRFTLAARRRRQALGSFCLVIGHTIRLQFAVATKLKNPEVQVYDVETNP